MAENRFKFRNAAAKLLAQHSVRTAEKLQYDSQTVVQPPLRPLSQVPAFTPPSVPTADRSSPVAEPPPPPPAAKPVPVNRPVPPPSVRLEDPTPVPAEMVTSLIKYIVVMGSALVGWAIAVFLVPETVLSGSRSIAAGLCGGAAVGFLISRLL